MSLLVSIFLAFKGVLESVDRAHDKLGDPRGSKLFHIGSVEQWKS